MLALNPQHFDLVYNSDRLGDLWEQLRQEWLKSSQGISGSKYTFIAYKKASELWMDFIALRNKRPWEVTSSDARAWLARNEVQRIESFYR